MNPGDRVASRYVVEGLLGGGGMGSVFVARDEKFGVRVALKIAHAQGGLFDHFKERFVREARVGNRLGKEKGFVRALDWGELPDSTLYLAMDLVEGAKPLDLASGTLPERLGRLRKAVRLVALAHKSGVIHRDVKPANFLQGADGTLWLSDFGLSKFKGELDAAASVDNTLTSTGVGMGTPAFMPPEQFDSARTVDERADVFALGVMLFTLLCGRPPFHGSMSEIVTQQMKVSLGREPMPRAGAIDTTVPAELDALCSSALALEHDKRLESAGALFQRLDAFLGGKRPHAAGTAGAPPAGTTSALPAAEPSSSVARVLVVAAPLVLLGILGVALVARAGHGPVPVVEESPSVAVASPVPSPTPLPSSPTSPTPLPTTSPSPTPPPPTPPPSTPPPSTPPPSLASPSPALPVASEPSPSPPPVAVSDASPAPAEPPPETSEMPAPTPTPSPDTKATPAVADVPPKMPRGLTKLEPRQIGDRTTQLYSWPLPGDKGDLLLVYVPSGDFTMGRDRTIGAKPAHTRAVAKGYWIGLHSVTWDQYGAFCAATKRATPVVPFWWGSKDLPPEGTHPVVNVDWEAAGEFCKWAGHGARLKLPTEAQWEKAARGTDGRVFPWGNDVPTAPSGFLNFCDASCPTGTKLPWQNHLLVTWQSQKNDGFPYTSPVNACLKGASPFGALDMAGNVAQWCEDEFHQNAYAHYLEGTKPPPSVDHDHIARGGSWCARQEHCHTWFRGKVGGYNASVGFRVLLEGE